MPKPYDKTTHDGKTVDWLTHCALLEAELKLGYRLTIVQGSYHKGVGASAGTHDGGGVVDLAPWDHVRKVRTLRDIGFAIWHRPKISGLWGEHCHGVLIGNTKLAPVAARQVTAYRNRRDGLAGNRADNTYRPSPIPTYKWPGSVEALALEAKVKAALDGPKKPPPPKPKGLRVAGIDLYHGNPVTQVALNAAVRGGVKFVCLKATEGSTIKDETYPDRLDMVTKAGAIPSAYGFGRPDKFDTVEKCKAEGVKEARFFLDYADPQPGDLRSMLDLEDRNGLGPKLLTAYVDGWVHEYERQVGCLPFIYTQFDLLDNFGCPLWSSRYNDANEPPHIPEPWASKGEGYTIHQFSNGEDGTPNRVAGFKAHAIDLNTIRKGLWLKDFLVPEKKPPPPPPPDPTGDTFVLAEFSGQPTDSGSVGTRQLRDVIKACDLGGFNQIESLWQRLVLKTSPKFGVYPTLGTAGYRPVVWRKTVFEAVEKWNERVYQGEKHVTPHGDVIDVTLRHKASGKLVTIVNGHAPAHIEVSGRERQYKGAEVTKYAKQLARAKAFFEAVRRHALAASEPALADTEPVILTGDYNVAYDSEKHLSESERVPWFPFTTLGSIAKAVMPPGGSHGSRRIDWVLIRGNIACRERHYGEQGSSDHKPSFYRMELL